MNATEIIGIIAGVITTVSSLPQLVFTVKSRDTAGISYIFLVLTTLRIGLWVAYGAMVNNTTLIVFNSISFCQYFAITVFKFFNEMKKKPPPPPIVV